MQMRRLIMTMFCLLPAAALMYGCGSSSKTGGTLSSVATVGDTACIQCHSAVTEPLTGEGLVTQYQNSSPHKDVNDGNGCEACHGGGAQHNGVGPIAYPKPDANRCATCHDGVTAQATNANTAFATSNHAVGTPSHLTSGVLCTRCHTHEGAVLSNNSGFTGDGTVISGGTFIPPAYTGAYTGIKCDTCHDHGGGLRSILAKDTAGRDVAWNPGMTTNPRSQFNLCTSCHTMYDYTGNNLLVDGVVTVNGSLTKPVGYHPTSWYRIIATTHYDDPLTTAVVEGYNLRKNSANPCFDCHGHEAKTETRTLANATIHTDWAQSAHAGGLLANKYASNGGSPTVASVMVAGVTDATGIAWSHYDWDLTYAVNNTNTTDRNNRSDCQRCHTATGAANFMTSPTTYNPKNNDFSHLSGWTAATATAATVSSGQNELLYCWGCHTNAGTGSLRKPGAITENYSAVVNATTGTTGTAVSVTYPNAGNSNVCMSCHLGRQIGDNIKNTEDADGVLGFINSHYLAAGGTVFGKTGYALGGRDYDSAAKGFVHDKLGISSTGTAAADAYIASNGLSTSGPCAACHMTSEKLGVKTSHKYSPFSEYTPVAPAVTNDISLNPLCVTCHSTRGAGTDAKAVWFEGTWKARSDAALEALRAQLDANGVYFSEAYPYFYAGPGGTGGAFTRWVDVFGIAEWKDAMGTAFNYNLLKHDPGAVAHNRYYTRRLIYDSIDKLDDGILNYSVYATLNALDATTTYKANAITFLIVDTDSATAGVQPSVTLSGHRY